MMIRIRTLFGFLGLFLIAQGAFAGAIDPDTVLDEPDNANENSFVISGSATDAGGSLLADVQVRIQDGMTGLYWDPAGFPTGSFSIGDPNLAWFSTTAGDGTFDSNSETWSTAEGANAFGSPGSGPQYTVEARAVDGNGNVDNDLTGSQITFLFDPLEPAAVVLFPVDGTSRIVTNTLSGEAVDQGIGVSTVQVRVQNMSTGQYWDGGAGFQAGVFWATATLSAPNFGVYSWDISFTPALSQGVTYQVVSKAFDEAGNVQTVFPVGLSSTTFVHDVSPSSNASVTGLFVSSITASWTLVNGATGYTLIASTSSANPPVVFTASAAVAGEATLTGTLTGLSANTAYRLFVNAVGPGVATPYNLFATSTTLANPPTGLTVTNVFVTSVTVQWTTNNTDSLKYEAVVSANSGFSSILATNEETTSNASASTTFTGLTANTPYYFRVRALNSNLVAGDYTASVSTTTGGVSVGADELQGTVKKLDSTPINLVAVEILNSGTNQPVKSTVTDADGRWSVTGLSPSNQYIVVVTYTLDGITSEIQQGNFSVATGAIAFTLEINKELAAISGSVTLAGASSLSARGVTSAASTSDTAYVEIYQRGRKVAVVPTDAQGRYTIPNLLPGAYALRAFNGLGFSEMMSVNLAAGQTQSVAFAFELLPEDRVYFYPNPAKDSTVLRFESAVTPVEARAAIYDIRGGLVKEFSNEESTRDGAEIFWTWDLRNASGEKVVTGVYLAQVRAFDPATGRRVVVNKKLAVIR